MNRAKISLLLLTLLLGFCTFALVNTRRTHARMQEMVRQTLALEMVDGMPDGESVSLVRHIDRLRDAWESDSRIVSVYSRHDEVERVSEDIQKLRPLCDTAQYTELRLTLCQIQASLDHLLDTELPTFSNIL